MYDGQGNAIDANDVKHKVTKRSQKKADHNIVREDVGTQLANLIPQWAVANKQLDCGCKSYETKMNRWGIAGCQQHEAEIIDHLVNQSAHLIPALRLAPQVMKRAVAAKLLQRAIQQTKKKTNVNI